MALSGRLVPQSGGGKFVKLDQVDGSKLVVSAKATSNVRSTGLRAIRDLWREAVRGSRGLQGHGDGARPACAFELEGEALLLIRLDDYAALATGEAEAYIQPDKGQQRRSKGLRAAWDD